MKRILKAFIFDLDGVITDTAEFHYQAWKRLADEEGIPFTRKDNEELRGVSRERSLELLLGGREYTAEEKKLLMERKNQYYQELIATITPDDLLPGAADLIKNIKENGYKLAVASASKNAKTVIKNLGLVEAFDHISDGYSVEKGKPAPDLFLFTADKMGVLPESCAVFEDARSGIKAAQAANMLAIGIGPVDRVGAADYVYDTIADVDLNEILE
ncbi:MAG: beta-phosphoglucomutase [Halanaerobiaceae bacterium]|nr:beta-phosphoglucomutase [Halanaerobiaceae bacterium]